MGAYRYFDNNATTPVDPRVRDEMVRWLDSAHGNPSSVHRAGREAKAAVETARARVATAIGGRPEEIVFTASGTEANNAVVFGLARQAGHGGELVVSRLEHPSIVKAAERCEMEGMGVRWVDPGPDGVVPAAAVIAALRPDTRLVSLMLANNEIGTLQPVAEVAAACRRREVPVLCDAVQAVGKVEVDVAALGVDYLTLGGHKFHGPLGAAALWIRPGSGFDGYLVGGSQERRLRASTVNVPAVAGLGLACQLARDELAKRRAHLGDLLRRFEAGVAEISGGVVHAAQTPRLPHTSHVAFPGLEGEALMLRLDAAGYAVSTGSACSSAKPQPSPTLLAMGVSPAEALASLRVSFGMTNTRAEVDDFLPVLAREVAALRQALAPV